MPPESLPVSFSERTPSGDDRNRRICDHCAFIDYVNPRIVAGVVAHDDEGRILICKRAIESRKGFWTLPAGFMERGESVEEGAMREAREEACAELEMGPMLAVFSIPRISQVQIFFRARLLNEPRPGPESEAVRLVRREELPLSEIAFPSVMWALEQYDRTRGLDVFPPAGNPPGSERLTRQGPAAD